MLSKSMRNRRSTSIRTRKKATVEDVNNIGVVYVGKKGTREDLIKSQSKDKNWRTVSNDYLPAVKRSKKKK